MKKCCFFRSSMLELVALFLSAKNNEKSFIQNRVEARAWEDIFTESLQMWIFTHD